MKIMHIEDINIIGQPKDKAIENICHIAGKFHFSRVRIAVAYATERGADFFLRNLRSDPDWDHSQKLFLIGFDHGLTQPEALKKLARENNSEVRFADGNELFTKRTLRRSVVFHPKVYSFDTDYTESVLGIFSGSSNLTFNGLSQNVEFGISCLENDASRSIAQSFESWWKVHWNNGIEFNDNLEQIYSSLRKQIRQTSPQQFLTEEVSPTELSLANILWIESGFLSGGSRNQLELPQGVEVFFGIDEALPDVKNPLTLLKDGNEWDSWLQFWGNQVLRLRMPTKAQGISEDYEDALILFNRLSGSSFDFEVIPIRSNRANRIRNDSEALGQLRKTRGDGGREYGWL
jgi:HKD family nuclease